MIDLDLNLVINTEKTSNNKLDLKNFSKGQDGFAKVFENANKSFEATKKSLENSDTNKYANKKVTKEKPEITKKENNNNKQKISDKEQNQTKKDNQVSDNNEQNSSKELDNNKEQIKKQDNQTEETSQTTDTVDTEKTQENMVLEENINKIVEDYRKLDNQEYSIVKKLEALTRPVYTSSVNCETETEQPAESEVQTENIKTNLEGLLLKSTDKTTSKQETALLEEGQETEKTKEPNFLQKLLFGKKQEADTNKVTEKTAQNAKETSEKLLNERIKASDLKDKIVEELKVADNKLLTQNPIKTLNTPENIFKGQSEFLVKSDKILNLQNVINPALKSEPQTTLSDVMAELDIDVEVKVDDVKPSLDNQLSQNQNQNEFNFNSSSFNDLNSHVTKLSLNKTADFSKVMNTKTVQQDNQILNQVKEATANSLSKGTTSVNIILRPEHLGRVHVNLVSQNGVLTAHFTAQTQQTADALNKNIETLRQNLLDQGVKVGEVNVKVQESSNSESLMNDNQSFEDKLGQTKEQYQSSKHNHRSRFDNDLENKNNGYLHNNSSDEEKDETLTSHNNINNLTNNDLGLYNNMGRTL